MPDPTNDRHIEELLNNLDGGYWPEKHAALTALVAERDALKQRVAELEAASKPAASDLRERLLESALRGAVCAPMMTEFQSEIRGRHAVRVVDAALDALRKGEA